MLLFTKTNCFSLFITYLYWLKVKLFWFYFTIRWIYNTQWTFRTNYHYWHRIFICKEIPQYDFNLFTVICSCQIKFSFGRDKNHSIDWVWADALVELTKFSEWLTTKCWNPQFGNRNGKLLNLVLFVDLLLQTKSYGNNLSQIQWNIQLYLKVAHVFPKAIVPKAYSWTRHAQLKTCPLTGILQIQKYRISIKLIGIWELWKIVLLVTKIIVRHL